MLKKNYKNKALIYVVYSENNIDFGLKKEEMLKKYCKDKNYEIIDIVRKPVPYMFIETVDNFINIIKKNDIYFRTIEFEKILVYDLNEIVPDDASLLSLLIFFKQNKVQIESIRQGKINYNPLDKSDLLNEDEFMLKQYNYSKNQKYFIEDPF